MAARSELIEIPKDKLDRGVFPGLELSILHESIATPIEVVAMPSQIVLAAARLNIIAVTVYNVMEGTRNRPHRLADLLIPPNCCFDSAHRT